MVTEKISTYIREDYNLNLFFELSTDLLCIAGFDGYFKCLNPAFSRNLGYSQEELFAKPINEFIHIDDRNITSSYRECIKQGKPLVNFENRYITKKGKIIWLSWTSIPYPQEKIVYAIAKNITHKKKLEEDRNHNLTHITKTYKELKKLSYTTSHDLRSPVNSLIGILKLLKDQNIQDQEVYGWVNLAKVSAENLSNTLNNQIDLLKEKELFQVKITEINLEECLAGINQLIPDLINDSKTVIDTDFSSVGTVRFNKPYLESIFLNLITNSIKYARPECSPIISIRSRKYKGTLQLIFSDNGLGFDMDKVKDKIFGFNQTFHNHKDSKGIGLYLIHNHITNLGGRISVESKINEGTTFTITFRD